MDAKVLFLEGVASAEPLFRRSGMVSARADSPLHAAWALAAGATDVIVVGEEAHWAHELLASMPAAKRPAVVAVGDEVPALAGLVDRWLKPGASEAQVASCFATALAQARRRGENVQGVACDSETGLPGREALLDALVRKAEKAKREHGELSTVVVRVLGDIRRAAKLLGGSTRRSEITARVGLDRLATLLQGGLRTGERARSRMDRQLRQAGIAADTFSHVLHLPRAVDSLVEAIGPDEALSNASGW